MILHIDMDAFFASVEQRTKPFLRGKPVAVTGSEQRTVITTSSYEARAFGVKTGMTKYEAKKLCPDIILVAGNNHKYTYTCSQIVKILKSITPMIEVYSIDESFLDLAGLQKKPIDIGYEIKQRIWEEFGLTCSVGIAPNKLIAKLASNMNKPDGLKIISKNMVPEILENISVNELWGIGRKLTQHLAAMNIYTCGQLGRFPVSCLRRRFGVTGEHLHKMGLGTAETPLTPTDKSLDAKSVGHSMTLPKDITSRQEIARKILLLTERVGRRMRRDGLSAKVVGITIRYNNFHTFCRQKTLAKSVWDTKSIYVALISIYNKLSLKLPVRLVGVKVSHLFQDCTIPLFEEEKKSRNLVLAVDKVSANFGETAILSASSLLCRKTPRVISPAWRPEGTRNYI
ncbi:MAG: DNA polymerase IV [Candidatus Theseobacter exili]|nr:DNA polymerase IV [Candidatus Theseobacter exili]